MDMMPKDGWIEVICGSMFAGKTEELIRRIKRLDFARKEYKVFKPSIDNRYSDTEVVSHSGFTMNAIVIDNPKQILDHIGNETEVVAVDEVQFMDEEIIAVADFLADKGIRVILAGLDKDFRGEPFGVMPTLITKAEFVTKLTAICNVCGAPATRTQRLVNHKPASYNDPIVMIGATESYEPRCRHCHIVTDKPQLI